MTAAQARTTYGPADLEILVAFAHVAAAVYVAHGGPDLLRSLGWSYRDMEHVGVSLPVIEAECQYLRPARYDDELEVRTEGRLLSPVRMEFTYEVRLLSDAVVSASGRTVHASLDPSGRPCRLPSRIREVFA